MKCALAAVGFINENITYNKKVITDTMIKYAGKADIILFGEAFLQGFYGAKFDPEQARTSGYDIGKTLLLSNVQWLHKSYYSTRTSGYCISY